MVLFQAILVKTHIEIVEKKITSFLLEKQFKDKATPVPSSNFILICGNFLKSIS